MAGTASEMRNLPVVEMGVVGVSRDCFPVELSRERTGKLVAECEKLGLGVIPCGTIVETETDAMKAAAEMTSKGVNALAVYLGNFGPEGPTTILAEKMAAAGVPFMLCGAAEESKDTLVEGRGDAYCGMLNASYNCKLRNLTPHVPENPVGSPAEVAKMIAHFADVARVVVGARGLKIFTFGPRPQDFFACNAPIKQLYDIGVEVMENSELDLHVHYRKVSERADLAAEVDAVAADMARELGEGNKYPEKLKALATHEVALLKFLEENLGSREFGVFANKCWPSFEPTFGFVPCYVNGRLASRGMPVSCEVDIYGAFSEYLAAAATRSPVTLLDVNNTVPDDLEIADLRGAARGDLFMGFHCGNSPSACLCKGYEMKFQLIMRRLMEPEGEPDITCGTLEGRLRPGPVTVFRVQGALDGSVKSYMAEGNVLDAEHRSFGGTGIIGIPGFARFYRHVLIEKGYPHHTAVAFAHAGRTLFDAVKLLGVAEIDSPRPGDAPYADETPFA